MNFIDYQMRGGEHPDIEREQIERQIAKLTLNLFMTEPKYHEKGIKWLFNLNLFHTLYCSNKEILDYLYNKKPYPEFCEIEVTTHCDMRCQLCEHTYWDVKPENMSFENFKKIINQMPDLRWVGMTGIGQSWLNPDYLEMMRYVKDRGIYIENFDNFKHITPNISKEIIDMGLDKLYVSMDAANKETYENIQVGAKWDDVIKNIKFFDMYKRSKNLYYPELWFHFIVMKENISQMEDYLQMIYDLDIQVEGIQFTRMLHKFKEVEDSVVDISEEKKISVLNKASELGLRVVFNINTANQADKLQIKDCAVWNQPFIFVDGTVIPCCSLNEQNDRKWQIKTSLGNLFKKPLRKIWKEDYYPFLNKLREGGTPEACKRCVLYR